MTTRDVVMTRNVVTAGSAVPAPAVQRLAGALAQTLVRPLSVLDPSACGLGPLPGQALLGAAPPFAAPLNRALARQLDVASLPVDAGFLDRLAQSPRTRLAVLLVTQGHDALGQAARFVAAAVLHRAVVSVVLGAQRARLRAALGEAAYEVATREALLLHAPLVAAEGLDALGDLSDGDALRDRLVERGLGALWGAVDAAEPALSSFFRRRFPPGGAPCPALTGDACDHVVRLLRRRMPAWAASIA